MAVPEYKLCVFGSGGVGKSCLVRSEAQWQHSTTLARVLDDAVRSRDLFNQIRSNHRGCLQEGSIRSAYFFSYLWNSLQTVEIDEREYSLEILDTAGTVSDIARIHSCWSIDFLCLGRVFGDERLVREEWARVCAGLLYHFTSNVQWFERILRPDHARERYRRSRRRRDTRVRAMLIVFSLGSTSLDTRGKQKWSRRWARRWSRSRSRTGEKMEVYLPWDFR